MKDKVYYCNITGEVLIVLSNLVNVKDFIFDEHYEMYSILNERTKETISLIELEFGEFEVISKNSTGMSVNLKTKQLEFVYDEIAHEPSEIEILSNKISILEMENAELLLDSAIKDLRIQTTENDIADLTLEVAIIGGM